MNHLEEMVELENHHFAASNVLKQGSTADAKNLHWKVIRE